MNPQCTCNKQSLTPILQLLTSSSEALQNVQKDVAQCAQFAMVAAALSLLCATRMALTFVRSAGWFKWTRFTKTRCNLSAGSATTNESTTSTNVSLSSCLTRAQFVMSTLT